MDLEAQYTGASPLHPTNLPDDLIRVIGYECCNISDASGNAICCCYHKHVAQCEAFEARRVRRRDVARALGIRGDGSQSTGTVGGPINFTPSDVMRHIYLLWQRSEQGPHAGTRFAHLLL